MFSFFKKPAHTHFACKECGVLFAPRDHEVPYGRSLCLQHARLRYERDRREAAIKEWAVRNIDRLEPEMLKEARDSLASLGGFAGVNALAGAGQANAFTPSACCVRAKSHS